MEEDYDVAVIGAGPGGYVAAIRLSQLGMKVVCIEQRELGGTCLNVGCIPSKTLLHSSELFWKIKTEGPMMGITGDLSLDWGRMQERKKSVISQLKQGIGGLFKKNKVILLQGFASFISSHTLAVTGSEGVKEVRAKFFIIATGSEPVSLPFLPIDEKRIVSSEGALNLEAVPERLAIVGAGVIGVELGSVFHRLGSKVQFIEFMDRVCPAFEPDISMALQNALIKQGMQFSLSTRVLGATFDKEIHLITEKKDGQKEEFLADIVLVAVGRKSFTKGLNLDKIGISLNSQSLIPIDSNFKTTLPHIFAIGDVTYGPMLAHKASEEGVVVAEIIANLRPSIQYLSIPNVVYTYPEVASVGMGEAEALKHGLSFSIGTYPFKGNSRAKCTGEEDGFIKILADKKTDKILGVHIIGPHASELIALAVSSIELGATAEEMGGLCQAHPTLSEAFKEAALSIHKKAIHK